MRRINLGELVSFLFECARAQGLSERDAALETAHALERTLDRVAKRRLLDAKLGARVRPA